MPNTFKFNHGIPKQVPKLEEDLKVRCNGLVTQKGLIGYQMCITFKILYPICARYNSVFGYDLKEGLEQKEYGTT